MSLSVSIEHRLGDFHLCADFACEGRLTALFGPSGSGKTSIINVIAGLTRPDRARIVIDGETLTDTSAGVFTPPHRRHIGYVFQEARLFPHMNVRQNLLYAQWFGGRRASAGAGFAAVVDMLGIDHLLRRYPSHLSGGEKQRVAIGRALLSHPRLLLMDEPLASLDDARKREILPYIERLRDEAHAPIVYVSHSREEVRRLANHVVMLDQGRVIATGSPQDTLAKIHEADESTDDNMLDVRAAEPLPDGLLAITTAAGVMRAPQSARAASRIRVKPEHIVLMTGEPGRTSAHNVLAGVVRFVEPSQAGFCRVRVSVGETELVARAPSAFLREHDLRDGANVYLLIADFRLI